MRSLHAGRSREGAVEPLVGLADIEQVESPPLALAAPGGQRSGIDDRHTREPAKLIAPSMRPGLRIRRGGAMAPRRATFQTETRPLPANGPVAQGMDGMGHADIAQGLRADNGTGPSRAVDDDGGARIGHEVADAIGEFGVGTVDPARDAELPVLVPGPAVEHDDIVASIDHAPDLGGVERRRAAGRLDNLPEYLGRHVQPLEQLETAGLPGGRAANVNGEAVVSQALENRRGPLRLSAAAVGQGNCRALARHQVADPQFEPGKGKVAGSQHVARREPTGFAHIEQDELAGRAYPLAQSGGVQPGERHSPGALSKLR